MKRCLLDLNFEEIEKIVSELGEPKFRAKQIFDAVFSGKQIEEITNISKTLREKLAENFIGNPVKIHTKLVSKDNTIKYVYELQDGNLVEGVLMIITMGIRFAFPHRLDAEWAVNFVRVGLMDYSKSYSWRDFRTSFDR
jgi:23S rRNA (adenine2503-C2)-methyltransferase